MRARRAHGLFLSQREKHAEIRSENAREKRAVGLRSENAREQRAVGGGSLGSAERGGTASVLAREARRVPRILGEKSPIQ